MLTMNLLVQVKSLIFGTARGKSNFCIKVVKNSDEEKQKANERFKANVCGTFRKGRRDSAGSAVGIATYARSSGTDSDNKPSTRH